ncbi:MAG: hypothetical protein MJ106_01780 [Lentisphaeria bacterium]|nr:hypothetical protein [Lentisphaeria bacterium]
MSGIAWIILNAALALAAVVGTVKVAKTPPPKPFTQSQLDGNADKQEKDSDTTKTQQKNTTAVQTAKRHPDELPKNASLDDLWKQTLFLPARAEAAPGDVDAEAAAQAAALAGQNFEFELVGIAQISPADQPPMPVALLRSKEAGGQRRRPTPQRRGGPAQPQRGGAPQQQEAEQEKKQPQKLIFREGDPLNNTGYLLKAIFPEQKMVEVSRGSETIKLYINYAGAEANQRREAIVKSVADKKEAARQEEARQQSIRDRQNNQRWNNQNPGAPPPPPGMNNRGQQNNGNQGNNRSQQIRNQVEQNARGRGNWQGGQGGRGNLQGGQGNQGGRGNWQGNQGNQGGRGNWQGGQGNQGGRGNWQNRQAPQPNNR